MRLGFICLILTSFLFAGCATSYHPANGRGYGFTEKRISEQSYRVAFTGNSRTSSADVEQMLLKRCAELTVLNGYNVFLIVEEDSDKPEEDEAKQDSSRKEAITQSVKIVMAHRGDISPEGLKKAVNAGIYLRGK